MNWSEIKKCKLPFPVVLVFITLALYLPFWLHLLDLRSIQLANKEDPGTVLPVYGTDSIGYTRLADSLIERHIFSGLPGNPPKLDTFRTIGYPGMIALFQFIFGSNEYFPFVQVVFAILTAVLTYEIGRKVFSEEVGMIAALFYIFDPNTIFHSLTLLSDVPFTFFLILSVYCLFFWDTKRVYLADFAGGALLGFATLVRAISTFMPILIIPLYFYLNWGKRSARDIVKSLAIFSISFLAILTPWLIRNHIVSGEWGVSSVKDFNFFHYSIPEYLAYKRGVTPDDIRRMLYAELKQKGVDPEDAASLNNIPILNSISHPYLWQNLPGYAVWHVFKLTPFFLSSGIKNFFYSYNDVLHYTVYATSNANLTDFLLHRDFAGFLGVLKSQLLISLEQIFWVAVFLLMFVPFTDKKRRPYVILMLGLIFYLALPTVPVAYSRFKVPAAPYMYMLAIAGLFMIKEYLRTRLSKAK